MILLREQMLENCWKKAIMT